MNNPIVVEPHPGFQYILVHGRFPQPVPEGYELEDDQEFISFKNYVEAVKTQPSVEETQEILEEINAVGREESELKMQLVNNFTSDELQALRDLVKNV